MKQAGSSKLKEDVSVARPLDGMRVLDLTDERGELGPWMLGELGADVIKVEPVGGVRSRGALPLQKDDESDLRSLQFCAYNSNKRSIVIDLNTQSGQLLIEDLIETADFIFESDTPGLLAQAGISSDDILEKNQKLVHVLITPFGEFGPRVGDPYSELTLASLGGPVNVQGVPERAPVKATIPQVWRHAGAEAAVAALVSHRRMLTTGEGQKVVVSAQAVMTWTLLNAMEAYEIQGKDIHRTGTEVRLAIALQLRVPTSDGWLIAICRGELIEALLPWLLEEGIVDESWTNEDWMTFDNRVLNGEPAEHTFEDLYNAVASLCKRYPKDTLMRRALKLGATLAPINDAEDLMNFDHLAIRNFWVESETGRGLDDVKLPGGYVSFDNERVKANRQPPHVNEHSKEIRDELAARATFPKDREIPRSVLPLEGLKVADFAWVGVGPITAKALADHGATVVRVESGSRLDPLRLNPPFKDNINDVNMSQFFGTFNTSKLGIDIDMKNPSGLDIAKRLVEWADVVVESWSPGAFGRTGLDDETIRALNPEVIIVHTSLLSTGSPLSPLAGYGYHAAAIAGFYEVFGWSDLPPDGPYLAYTDTISPRFLTPAVLAAVDRLERTGRGCTIDAAQLECGLQLLAPELLAYQISGEKPMRSGNRDPQNIPQGVYPVLGEDRWIAISIEDDANWSDLCRLMNKPKWAKDLSLRNREGRNDAHDQIDKEIAAWTKRADGKQLESTLLEAGIPAGLVQRSSDLLVDKQYEHMKFYRRHVHGAMGEVPYAGHQYRIDKYDHGPLSASPLLGEHTFEILSDHLKLTADEIADFAVSGALG
jgi:crotonobetainyl-CoA:carnitine CoA-transferase CaiB-like acyl-CoA transferase